MGFPAMMIFFFSLSLSLSIHNVAPLDTSSPGISSKMILRIMLMSTTKKKSWTISMLVLFGHSLKTTMSPF
jgi:hypothetical protein